MQTQPPGRRVLSRSAPEVALSLLSCSSAGRVGSCGMKPGIKHRRLDRAFFVFWGPSGVSTWVPMRLLITGGGHAGASLRKPGLELRGRIQASPGGFPAWPPPVLMRRQVDTLGASSFECFSKFPALYLRIPKCPLLAYSFSPPAEAGLKNVISDP